MVSREVFSPYQLQAMYINLGKLENTSERALPVLAQFSVEFHREMISLGELSLDSFLEYLGMVGMKLVVWYLLHIQLSCYLIG